MDLHSQASTDRIKCYIAKQHPICCLYYVQQTLSTTQLITQDFVTCYCPLRTTHSAGSRLYRQHQCDEWHTRCTYIWCK